MSVGGGLAAELDRLLEMARELEARVERGSPATARDLCAALAATVDNAIRLAGSRSCGAIAAAGSGKVRKRGAMEKVRQQVRVSSVHDLAALEDGLSWRKYGQKDILGAKYPRAYFRCTHRHSQGCQATKQVQRAAGDPLLFDVVYHGGHTCAQGSQHQHQQQHASAAGQEQQQQQGGSPVGADGMQWPLEPVTPFSFPSSPAGNGGFQAGGSGGSGADMGFEAQLDELLFLDPSEFLQPGFHNWWRRRRRGGSRTRRG